ncbi:hypothetical protein [Pseudobacteriovorax antillogorgiicola]|uniref:DUF4336 domain-containing protein n=1 Tax=Pseudobacteriovorax antillogorgiicola TaxID=1513793 RepID=A0A1Y6C917_9BACT|nr:hypothetical protein [Pseudobacteriovorax antillogorgiicola]TCS49811.1 hypothetical protein EDD56_11456 [Pseudobacteriovorax antillogorgiicola]SMF43114.1 hypothetical protein SAMN06296036_11355 [Pseudobacteriovorax antillogorgiicola]
MKEISSKIMESLYSFKIMPGIRFPVRSTVIELSSGDLLVLSPGPGLAGQLKGFGKEHRDIFVASPNALHYAYVEEFLSTVSQARYFAPEGVRSKNPSLRDRIEPLEKLKAIIAPEIEMFDIQGNPFLQETVFFHKANASLIVTDLCFNMREEMSFLTALLLRMVGAYQKVGQSKIVKKTTKDPRAYRHSVTALKSLEPKQVIVGHGSVIEQSQLTEFWQTIGASGDSY